MYKRKKVIADEGNTQKSTKGLPSAHPANSRNNAVDALRAVLILSVMLYHYLVFWAPPFTSVDHYHYDQTYPHWIGIGKYGVHVFFIISGYVITMTLERSTGALDFAFRRFARLFPALFVCSLLTYLVLQTPIAEIYHVSFLDWLGSLTAHAEKMNLTFVDGSYWSLGVEVRFYFWVAIFFALLKDRFWIAFVIIGVATIGADLMGKHLTNVWLVGSHISFFLVGMSFRYFELGKSRTAAICTLAVGALLYALRAPTFTVDGEHLALVNAYILSMAAVCFLVTNTRVGEALYLGPLPYAGRVSYAFYLLHQAIGVTIIGGLNRAIPGLPDFAVTAFAAISCFALAALVHHLVEEPGRRFIMSWRKSSASRSPIPIQTAVGS